MIKLSIIIPCFNAEPYIYELLDRLDKQVTDEVEVILIDDGSKKPIPKQKLYPWLHVIRQENLGASAARNRGLEIAKGDIIGFIDADDLVSEKYVSYILSRADEEWDYMDLSWKSLENNRFVYKLYSDSESLPNPSASTRVFKRKFIGDTRFPEKKDVCEDEHFTRHLGLKDAKHICATEFMYFYRIGVPGSSSKKFFEGKKNVKRIAYYFNRVTKDMTHLIDEFKQEDEENEIYLLTNDNQIPELEKYCQVFCPPRNVRAMESRGEANNYVNIIPLPVRTQVIIYASTICQFGGIETFIYSFCMRMKDYYDIIVLYKSIDQDQFLKLEPYVRCEEVSNGSFICDTLIMNRMADDIPGNVAYKKSIQVLHAVNGTYKLDCPKNRDEYVAVSNVVKNSFKDIVPDIKIIRNMTYVKSKQEPLLLVSTTRLDTPEKGQQRMIQFAKLLEQKKIPFIWIYFSNRTINGPKELIRLPQNEDISGWVAKADYVVQLSDSEGMSYSILEAMVLGTRLIVTPLPMLKEIGFKEGKHGTIIPFDLNEVDVNTLNLSSVKRDKTFSFDNKNIQLIKKWRVLLGDTIPKHDYKPDTSLVRLKVVTEYHDVVLQKKLFIGQIVRMKKDRAKYIVEEKGYCEYV